MGFATGVGVKTGAGVNGVGLGLGLEGEGDGTGAPQAVPDAVTRTRNTARNPRIVARFN